VDNEHAPKPLDLLEPLISEAAVAEYLWCPPKALRRLREQRLGPPFVMVGKVAMYRPVDVETWVARVAAASAGTKTEEHDHLQRQRQNPGEEQGETEHNDPNLAGGLTSERLRVT
jgi:hypothetical protein